jgi:hypothetical protein
MLFSIIHQKILRPDSRQAAGRKKGLFFIFSALSMLYATRIVMDSVIVV